ncbi:MAG: RluA family pseudouridine synthase [Synergistetes bacterium]|nr:RluA family pseudouridine synthase [Synergistota bacterium]
MRKERKTLSDFLSFQCKDRLITLREFLARELSISRRMAKRLIDRGWVFVNEERVSKANFPLSDGDRVEAIIYEPDYTYDILYEDEYIVAISKPPFMPTNESPKSLESTLRRDGYKVRAIHRLDLETTGAVLFAKGDGVFNKFKELFKKKEIGKLYIVIVEGRVDREAFEVSFRVGGKEAHSFFRVLKRGNIATLLQARITTGRKHQIRIHLSMVGHPVVGEKLYRKGRIWEEAIRKVPRCMLHCEELSFKHPLSGKLLKIRAPLPEDFKRVWEKLLYL